ncbi:MAG: nuclear transport factor 2 family protein [Pleurocapsa sp. MO_192.B19]|nr:nuclear transport factor 2 family protein [Pleurocapsa sp. MO_192.B19]
MKEEEKRQLIEQYVSAYNAFDVDGMISLLHPEIEFKNISGGEVDSTLIGKSEFRAMAEESKAFFKLRKQTINRYDISNDRASIDISYEGVLATDLSNEMKSGETIRLDGRSEFFFKDGKIYRIIAVS